MLSTEAVFKDMSIGIVVVMIGTMIYIIRILYKKERKRKFDLEGSNYDITMLVVVEHPPKKTAAKYLEGIKEATQKILRPLKKIASSKDLPSSQEFERNSSHYHIISSTKSFKTKSRTSELLNYDFNYNSRVISLISPPPPLHLKSQDENIEINSMQTSLSDTQPSSLKIPAQVPSRVRSFMTSPISSRSSSRSSSRISLEMTSSRDPLNPKVSSENSIQPIAKDETNDYTNFQPIQNIKPIQNSQLLDKGKTVVG